MEHDDGTTTPQGHSVTERQLRPLVLLAPAAYDRGKRIDLIHEPGLDIRWGAE